MRRRIPYLAGLARQTAGQTPLRPSRRLFAGDAYGPNHRTGAEGADKIIAVTGAGAPRVPAAVTSSRRDDAADIAPDQVVASRGAATAYADRPAPVAASPAAAAKTRERAGGPQPPSIWNVAQPEAIQPRGRPAGSAMTSAGAAVVMAPTVTDRGAEKSRPTSPPTVSPPRSDQTAAAPAAVAQTRGSPAGSGHVMDAPTAMRAIQDGAHPQVPPQSTQRGGRPDARRPKAADSPPALPVWGMPVELPPGIDPIGGVPANLVGSPDVIPGISHTRDSVADPPPSRAAPIQDLLPRLAPASPAVAQFGNGRGGHRNAAASSRASVSIGTIDITVLPPAKPAPPPDVPAPAQPAPSRLRAGSALAVGAGSDRLRDGVRRWYGTAQG